ncbi:ribonuclease E/G [SAR116 cluster bacterium]|nr:ribonuclease E/G [SAR116 cluster bacterium]
MTSPTEILSEHSLGHKRISFFLGNKLLECWIEKENTSLRIGEIHYARVIKVEKLLNRIFYKLNNGVEVSSRFKDKNPIIGDLEIITIIAEERENKPAHAQQGFFLKGGSAIIIDKKEFLGISKKIINIKERERITEIAKDTGLYKAGAIIRSSAESNSDDELIKNFTDLVNQWRDIKKINLVEKKEKKLFNGFSLEKQAQFLYPKTKLIKDNFSSRFNKLNGTDQILEAYNKIFKIKNGGTISFEKTKALITIDIDSSKRDLYSGGVNKLAEDALDLCLHLIRLRSVSGLIVIDMPRLKKTDYNERIDQIKIWSERINKNVKVLGGTRGGLTEIVCNHERTSLEDNERNISVFVALEALRCFIVREKKSKSKLYVSENIMNIFNLELKKQINEIKNFAKFTNVLIDENLGYNNFYIE